MDINSPKIDWLTFTTYKQEKYLDWRLWQQQQLGESSKGKIKMYSGYWKGASFVGEGVQGQQRHAMVRVSGSDAHDAFKPLFTPDGNVKCTRLDVQITTWLPKDYSARQFKDDLEKLQEGEYKRDIQLIENTDGLDTVYVGSRKSERYARFYVKQSLDGDLLRFEVEHKGDRAKFLGMLYYAGSVTLGGILGDFLDSVGVNDTQGVISMFLGLINQEKAGCLIPAEARDEDRTMAWIYEQVTPAMVRLLNDHDRGHYLADHLRNILKKAGYDDD